MINYDRIIIIGANSGIARLVIPELRFLPNKIDLVYRTPPDESLFEDQSQKVSTKEIRVHIGLENLPIIRLENEKILILNFAAVFGAYDELFQLDQLKISENVKLNLNPYLVAVNFVLSAAKGSTLIGFSGGGIGGDSIEKGNLGYLMSKASICFMFESLASTYRDYERFFILIAPGPFPTNMQRETLNSKSDLVSENSRNVAISAFSSGDKRFELADFLNTVASDPASFSGKTLSLTFDNLIQIKSSQQENFGKLRRVT